MLVVREGTDPTAAKNVLWSNNRAGPVLVRENEGKGRLLLRGKATYLVWRFFFSCFVSLLTLPAGRTEPAAESFFLRFAVCVLMRACACCFRKKCLLAV